MAALSNVGMLSFAAFRIGVACGGPSRLLGVINVMCVLLWISVVGVRRALSLTRSPADAT